MEEATGQTGLMNIMLTIIGVIIVLLAGSISYSKAFRVKNKIINILEKYEKFDKNSKQEIESMLTNIGYRIIDSSMYKTHCPADKFSANGFTLETTSYPGHLYCIYTNKTSDSKTYHYKVVSFMYFDIPVIGNFIEIPITGETKVFYSDSNDEWKTVK